MENTHRCEREPVERLGSPKELTGARLRVDAREATHSLPLSIAVKFKMMLTWKRNYLKVYVDFFGDDRLWGKIIIHPAQIRKPFLLLFLTRMVIRFQDGEDGKQNLQVGWLNASHVARILDWTLV
jgi:hypothetical protein